MINQKNYISHIERLGFENLPDELKQAHLVIMTKTDNGRNWKSCEKDKELKELVNIAFQKLQEYISSKGKGSLNGYFTPRTAAISFIKPYIDKGDTMSLHPNLKLSVKNEDYSAHIEGENVVVSSIYGEPIHESFALKDLIDEIVRGITSKKSKPKAEKKEKKPDCIEVKFFRLMLYWNNKIVTKSMLAKQIEDLQANILNKRIRKTSPFAKEIAYLQESLVDIHNTMSIHYLRFKLKDETVQSLKQAIKKFAQMDYFNTDEEPKNTVDLSGINSLEHEVNEDEHQETIQGNDNAETETGQVMNSVDFSKLEFDSIGLKDKWLKLIGDPAPGFSAMVFGKPKMGKSYLCVDFAGYLARNHGPVLYVAREEKLDATLQKKLRDKDVAHPNLFVSDYLPEDLSSYDFVFIDSVNKLGLSPQDIETLRTNNHGKSFIFVFQTTKEGNFRGTNEFQHDVDVVIEVPENGKAVQFGRFNQGGEMSIFEEESLEGIEKKKPIVKKALRVQNKKVMLAGNSRKMEKSKYPAWTRPSHLNAYDHEKLQSFFNLYSSGNFEKALKFTDSFDTILREEIPVKIWKEIGGKLTKSGEAELKKANSQQLTKKLKKYDDRSDDMNPNYMFSTTATRLLCEALDGDFDIMYIIRKELANRGVDKDGKWVGFPEAKKVHGVE